MDKENHVPKSREKRRRGKKGRRGSYRVLSDLLGRESCRDAICKFLVSRLKEREGKGSRGKKRKKMLIV